MDNYISVDELQEIKSFLDFLEGWDGSLVDFQTIVFDSNGECLGLLDKADGRYVFMPGEFESKRIS